MAKIMGVKPGPEYCPMKMKIQLEMCVHMSTKEL